MVNLSSTLVTVLAGAGATMAMAASIQDRGSSQYCVPHAVNPWEQSKIFEGFVNEFYVVRDVPKAFHKYVMADFIQHNPYEEPHGALPSQKYLTPLFANSSIGVKVLHQGLDGGIGWVHFRLNHFYSRPIAIADIFRFNGSCIQEHWDVTQELPKDATNPIALF